MRLDPGLARGLVLLADVDVRRGVVADQHGREAEPAELRDLGRDLLPDPRRERGPVHLRGSHAGKPNFVPGGEGDRRSRVPVHTAARSLAVAARAARPRRPAAASEPCSPSAPTAATGARRGRAGGRRCDGGEARPRTTSVASRPPHGGDRPPGPRREVRTARKAPRCRTRREKRPCRARYGRRRSSRRSGAGRLRTQHRVVSVSVGREPQPGNAPHHRARPRTRASGRTWPQPVTGLHWCRAPLRPPERRRPSRSGWSSASSTRSTSSATATGSTSCSPRRASTRRRASSSAPVETREAIRELLYANNRQRVEGDPTRCSARAAARARFTLDLEPPALEPEAPGVDGLLGRVLAVAYGAMVDGTWSSAEGLPQPRLPLGLLRLLAEPLGELVLDAALRQPDEDARLPAPARRDRVTRPKGARTALPGSRRCRALRAGHVRPGVVVARIRRGRVREPRGRRAHRASAAQSPRACRAAA